MTTLITPLPTPPTRQDSINFNDRADDFLGALPLFQQEANALAMDVQSSANEVEISRQAVISVTNISKWISGNTYSEGSSVWSPINGVAYRKITSTTGGTIDPSNDTTNYKSITDANGVIYIPAVPAAVSTTVQNKLQEHSSVFDFMTADQIADVKAKTLTVDVTSAVQAAIDSISTGTLEFPPGDYKITSQLSISGKNQQNDGTARNFEIVGYGARLNSTVASGTAYLLNNNKALTVRGIGFVSAGGIVEFDGLWRSNFEDVSFGPVVKFSPNNLDTFDSHYWNTWYRCDFPALEFHVGIEASGDRTEFNSNSFYNCTIWYSPTYAISVYGTAFLRGVHFYNCDISYYTTGMIYVSQTLAGGEINFHGGFFDSADTGSVTRNLVINTTDFVNAPNGGVFDSSEAYVASVQTVDVVSANRNGSRLPISSANLIKNGDFKLGTLGVVNSGLTLTAQTGAGFYNRYVNANTTLTRNIEFQAIPIPVSGSYCLTSLVRRVSGTGNVTSSLRVNGIDSFGGVNLESSSWSISSWQSFFVQGDTVVLRINFPTDAAGNSIDFAYVGLTFGKTGQLFAPTIDLAGFATYDPVSLVDGAGVTTTVTCTGAVVGMFTQASFSNDLQGVQLNSWVSAANTVSVRFQNETGATVDLASGTITVKVN